MKPVATLLLFACLQRSIPLYCQQYPLVSISEKNAPLEKILKIIQKQTGYTYFGDAAWIGLSKNVTLSVKNTNLHTVLDLCFKDQPLSYALVGNNISITVKEQNLLTVHGKVINEQQEPVPGATVMLKGSNSSAGVITNDSGLFVIRVNDPDAILLISSVNYELLGLGLIGRSHIIVQLKTKISELENAVVVNNGYQGIQKDRATGSFAKVDNELINRRVSPNILDRIDGVTSSVIFNTNAAQLVNQSPITIRGRSTILANPDPLIVIDNFPYTGDINNLNPDDVESITVLKDAAAASIWGAFSGNGVIVITTKKGKYNQAPKLSFNTSTTVGAKPNLYYQPILSSSDYIAVEQFLFNNGRYDGIITSPQHTALSPAVEIMLQLREGLLDSAQAQAQLSVLHGQDTRQDLDKYYYQTSWNQQYSLNLSGGTERNQYYLSGGYDNDQSNLVRNGYDRVTLNGTNTYLIVPKRLELSTGFAYTASTTPNNNTGGDGVLYPYVKLADAKGNALAVPFQLRESYADTAGGGKLLDWHYRPLDELRNADKVTRLTDYRINFGLKYSILKGLNAQASYQYGHGVTNLRNYQSLLTYTTRYLINEYTQVDSSGNLSYPVPMGGILDQQVTSYNANNVRLQLSYDHSIKPDQDLDLIAGTELRDIEGQTSVSRLYGYNNNLETSQPVDYTGFYSQYSSPGTKAQIPYLNQNTGTSDRYISYYFNGSYIYRQRYILSASARRDESNLFGVNTNQKGVPLWSLGGAWEISREAFYRINDVLPFLKLRITNGYNGNVDKSVSAYTTVLANQQANTYGENTATIINPPNPDLRWERINIVNTAIDFSTRGGRVEGSLEYYIKSGKDLIGQSPLDPTTGVTLFTGNTANMVTHGIDLTLRMKNNKGAIRWNGVLLFSYVKDKVTSYGENLGSIGAYFTTVSLNPLVGRPLYSIYAYRWKGLDPQDGDPQGWLNNMITKNYSGISNSSDFSNLLYKGPVNPPFFGSLRNTVAWRQFGLSFNILYKFGYYFRRNSIYYASLFSGTSAGHPDYDRRWMHPGDEKITNVPSMIYPDNVGRDNLYEYSEILIEKGDHIRLQDLRLSYDLSKKSIATWPVQAIQFYCYANNIGILWRANHRGIDPDYVAGMPNPRTLAIGMKMGF